MSNATVKLWVTKAHFATPKSAVSALIGRKFANVSDDALFRIAERMSTKSVTPKKSTGCSCMGPQ